MTYSELKSEINSTPLGEKMRTQKSEGSFYGAIEKLSKKERILKHKGRLFTPTALKQFHEDVAIGIEKDEDYTASGGQRSPTGDAILSFLRKKTLGADSAEIKEELFRNDEIKDKILKHNSFFYNVLAILTKKGLIKKENGIYHAI